MLILILTNKVRNQVKNCCVYRSYISVEIAFSVQFPFSKIWYFLCPHARLIMRSAMRNLSTRSWSWRIALKKSMPTPGTGSVCWSKCSPVNEDRQQLCKNCARWDCSLVCAHVVIHRELHPLLDPSTNNTIEAYIYLPVLNCLEAWTPLGLFFPDLTFWSILYGSIGQGQSVHTCRVTSFCKVLSNF